MIVLIEPISKNIGMYVPAYPLPLLEIASYVSHHNPNIEIKIISIPVDYGLPIGHIGRKRIYRELISDLSKLKPKGVGISCTAISQAEEAIYLSERIKALDPDIFIFMGGYFPTIYYEEIFSRTNAVDTIVAGEGEMPARMIMGSLEKGDRPNNENIPNLIWGKNGHRYNASAAKRFNLKRKAPLNLELLAHPESYDILPYAFSRGCPYQCNFCMEDYIRPQRKVVPLDIVRKDLANLIRQGNAQTLLVSDALFRSFDLFPFLRSLDIKINFETRCDILDPSLIPQIADACGIIALGFESASYNTLRRMNKIRHRGHYEKYLANTLSIFKEAARNEIPMVVFMIAGYPGDTEADLKESLAFAQKLSENKGTGGHVFKIGECHVYPKTKIHALARSLPDVVFEDDGVFGQNIVKQPSKDLNFETVLDYTKKIFDLSHYTPKLQRMFLNMMPFFRLPAAALTDEIIPKVCFHGNGREIFNVTGTSLSAYKNIFPELSKKYRDQMSGRRSNRNLTF